jgi:hypothetical protein
MLTVTSERSKAMSLNTSRSITGAVVMPYFTSRYCPTTVGTARRAAEA